MRYFLTFLTLAGLCDSIAFAERVPASQRYERLICVAPMTGVGTPSDPRRPLFAPVPSQPNGIMGFSFQEGDDGKTAIVEFVARSASELRAIEVDPRMKCFSPLKHKKQDAEKELKKAKKNFDFSKFGVNAQ